MQILASPGKGKGKFLFKLHEKAFKGHILPHYHKSFEILYFFVILIYFLNRF